MDNYNMWQLLGHRVVERRLGHPPSPFVFAIQLLCNFGFIYPFSVYLDHKLFGAWTVSYHEAAERQTNKL